MTKMFDVDLKEEVASRRKEMDAIVEEVNSIDVYIIQLQAKKVKLTKLYGDLQDQITLYNEIDKVIMSANQLRFSLNVYC